MYSNSVDLDVDFFAPEDDNIPVESSNVWNILVVDDDEDVHTITKLALNGFTYKNKKIHITSAYSAHEAYKILGLGTISFALVLLDVIMESDDAGLKIVEFIREKLNDPLMRIIIRTGQPGKVIEHEVIENYDINDYKEKTELTTNKLYTVLRTGLAQYQQLIDLEEQKNLLYQNLIYDGLTNVYSRYKLYEELKKDIDYGMIIIDINNFYALNHNFGYDIGDKILVGFSAFLKKYENNDFKVFRLEADRFAFLLENANNMQLQEFARNLKLDISEYTGFLENILLRLSITIGIAVVPKEKLIESTMLSLSVNKKNSMEDTIVYSDDLDDVKDMKKNIIWAIRLMEAVDANNVLAYYQPIVDCKTNEIMKYEVLVRLKYQDQIYTPYYFLGAARDLRYLAKITLIVFEHACKKFQNNNYSFSINVTDQDLTDRRFIENLESIRLKYNIEPTRISLEILEETNISSNQIAKKTLMALHHLGYLLSIDDFGVEGASFSQLNDLHIDSIKIDGSFIKKIDTDINACHIVEAILHYAKTQKIKSIAEFVHKDSVYQKIKDLEIDYAQGFYLSEPQEDL